MVQLWECIGGGGNDFGGLTFKDDEDLLNNLFEINGRKKDFGKIPRIMPTVYKKVKKQPPVADIGNLVPGAIILNTKAYFALKDFLLQFGELLELDCEGEKRYFYNITNLISVIDYDKSRKIGTAVVNAEFLQDAIPHDAQILKDPLTARTRIYLTQPAKAMLEQMVSENSLTGLRFFEAGTKF